MELRDGDAGLWARFAWFNEQLKAGTFPRPSGMARIFGVSVDTARRTIERFERHLGAPISYDPSRKGYYYPPGCHAVDLPPLWLADPASSVLLSGLALMSHTLRQGDSLGEPYGELLPGKYGRLANRMVVETLEHHPPDSDVFLEIVEAIASDQGLEIRYAAKTREEPTIRAIEPLILHSFAGNWYVYAHCRERKERRLFALDRIQGILKRGPAFDYADHIERSDPRAELSGVFGVHKRLEREWASIRFLPRLANWVRDQIWHPSQELAEQPDGGVILRLPFGADGLDVLREVLKFGPDAEILEPDWLRAEMRRRLQDTLRHYRS